MEAEEVTPTTLAADAAQQGVTDLIAALDRINRNYDLARSTHITIREAAAALTALSAERDALAAQVAELTRERDRALSAARQQDKLREATLGTLRSVSAALDAAEAKVARLEGALRYCEQAPFSGWTIAQAMARAALTDGTPE